MQPFLERLSEETHESSSASLLDGHEIVYIARSAQRRIMSVGLSVGTRLPAFCTSMGRVLLAWRDPEEARARILAGKPRALTPHTITDPERLLEILAQVREQGHCIVDQELELGLISLAMPLFNARGEVDRGLQHLRPDPAQLGAGDGRAVPAADARLQAMLRPLIT